MPQRSPASNQVYQGVTGHTTTRSHVRSATHRLHSGGLDGSPPFSWWPLREFTTGNAMTGGAGARVGSLGRRRRACSNSMVPRLVSTRSADLCSPMPIRPHPTPDAFLNQDTKPTPAPPQHLPLLSALFGYRTFSDLAHRQLVASKLMGLKVVELSLSPQLPSTRNLALFSHVACPSRALLYMSLRT